MDDDRQCLPVRAVLNALVAIVVKSALLTIAIALLAYAWPERPQNPEALRQNSGNTVFYDHRYECWTSDGIALAPVPTHVVMRVEGYKRSDWFYGGTRWTKVALNDALVADNPDVYVYAFCK